MEDFWNIKVENNQELKIMLKDFGLMQEVLNVMDDSEGFNEVGNNKKTRSRLLIRKEPG